MPSKIRTANHRFVILLASSMSVFLGFQMGISSVQASQIYEEDFSSDPGFTEYYTPTGSEYFNWDDVDEVYKIRINDTSDVNKFSLSPQFPKVENISFTVSVDINRQYTSFGQGMGVRFFGSDVGYDQRSLMIHHKGATAQPVSNQLRISDAEGPSENVYWSPITSPDTWYRVTISYDAPSGTANIEIIERDSGDPFFQENDVPFNPSPFDVIGLGDHTIWGEGTYAEMFFDNIAVVVPEPTTAALLTCGLVGLALLRRLQSSRNT